MRLAALKTVFFLPWLSAALLASAPAAADDLQTGSELIENNSTIRVSLAGAPEVRVESFVLIHPDGQEFAATDLDRRTVVRETDRAGGGGGGVSTGVGVGVGSGGGVSTGVGIGINLGTLFSDDDDEPAGRNERTTTVGTIAIPQPIHYLQLWQDYRLEVRYRDAAGPHVLTIPTPRPARSGG